MLTYEQALEKTTITVVNKFMGDSIVITHYATENYPIDVIVGSEFVTVNAWDNGNLVDTYTEDKTLEQYIFRLFVTLYGTQLIPIDYDGLLHWFQVRTNYDPKEIKRLQEDHNWLMEKFGH